MRRVPTGEIAVIRNDAVACVQRVADVAVQALIRARTINIDTSSAVIPAYVITYPIKSGVSDFLTYRTEVRITVKAISITICYGHRRCCLTIGSGIVPALLTREALVVIACLAINEGIIAWSASTEVVRGYGAIQALGASTGLIINPAVDDITAQTGAREKSRYNPHEALSAAHAVQ